ncbi:MAG: GNAT family N-acetyltransferase [Lachnospiraceae bacterium]|jgi:ribosomal-protein-alanine N-acetyltransferase|nr:GNAT family N-acetyltransferase [Lachnospiraceae bacterium]
MTHLGTVNLETNRLLLRRVQISDAQALFQNGAADPEVTRYMTWSSITSLEGVRAIISKWVESYANPEYYQWVIILKSLGEPIGVIDTSTNPHGGVGYWIGKQWWHQGLMTEVLSAVLSFMFEQVGVNRQQGYHDPRNQNSGTLMRKCGMQYEGTSRQSWVNGLGETCDKAQYGILADDYFGRTSPMPPMENYGQGVAAVVIRDGKVLVARHTYGVGKGRLIIPGGYCHVGESPQDALKREYMEETGIVIEAHEIISVRFNMHDWYVVFRADYVSGVERADGNEISEILWLTPQEIEEWDDVANLTKFNIQAAFASRGLAHIPSYTTNNNRYQPYSLYQ